MWFGLVLAACEATDVELVAHERWQTDGCSITAATVESGVLELDTNACSPVRASQVLTVPIEAGAVLEVVWWHDFLFAEEPAVGHLRLLLDDVVVYDVQRAIPGPPQATTEVFEATSAGAWLTVEVDNHGANTWNLLRLTRLGDRRL